jgi:hypothetical protein
MAEAPALKSAKTVTLVTEFDIYDSTEGVATWYRSGDTFEVVPPFLQVQVELGAAKLV